MHALGDYTIEQELTAGKTFLASDAGGRKVILKLLPPDCLLGDQLNPTVSDRLRRVREIAMTDVANLRGVERAGQGVFLVWEYVEGHPLNASTRDSGELVRELKHAVEQFHSTGLVHGALHERNVLVDHNGAIKLIDVSPLLFLDPKRDEQALAEMCRRIAGPSVFASDSNPRVPRIVFRPQTLLVALLVAIVGMSAAIGIHRIVRGTQPQVAAPPKMIR